MSDQITMHRTEVLEILRHVHEIRKAISRSRVCMLEDDLEELEVQLTNIANQTHFIIKYFEQEHHIGIKPQLI